MCDSASFQALISAFEAQAVEISRLNEKFSKIDDITVEHPYFDGGQDKLSCQPNISDLNSRSSIPLDAVASSSSLNAFTENQAQALADDLKTLQLEPSVSESVVNALKKHILLGLKSYVDSSTSNTRSSVPSLHSQEPISQYHRLYRQRSTDCLTCHQQANMVGFPETPVRSLPAYRSLPVHSFVSRDCEPVMTVCPDRNRSLSAQRHACCIRNSPQPVFCGSECTGNCMETGWHLSRVHGDCVSAHIPVNSSFTPIISEPPTSLSSTLPPMQHRRRSELARANDRFLNSSDCKWSHLASSSSHNSTVIPVHLLNLAHSQTHQSPSIPALPRASLHCQSTICACPLSLRKQELLTTNSSVYRGFERLAAIFRGKLVRDLFSTKKVAVLIRTIKDTAKLMLSLYLEPSVPLIGADEDRDVTKDIAFSQSRNLTLEETQLDSRLNVQLRNSLKQLHEIFVQWPKKRQLDLLRSSPAWRLREERIRQRTASPPLPTSMIVLATRETSPIPGNSSSVNTSRLPNATSKVASGDSSRIVPSVAVPVQRRTSSLPAGVRGRFQGGSAAVITPSSGGDTNPINSRSTAFRPLVTIGARGPALRGSGVRGNSSRGTAVIRWRLAPDSPFVARPIELVDTPSHLRPRRKPPQVFVSNGTVNPITGITNQPETRKSVATRPTLCAVRSNANQQQCGHNTTARSAVNCSSEENSGTTQISGASVQRGTEAQFLQACTSSTSPASNGDNTELSSRNTRIPQRAKFPTKVAISEFGPDFQEGNSVDATEYIQPPSLRIRLRRKPSSSSSSTASNSAELESEPIGVADANQSNQCKNVAPSVIANCDLSSKTKLSEPTEAVDMLQSRQISRQHTVVRKYNEGEPHVRFHRIVARRRQPQALEATQQCQRKQQQQKRQRPIPVQRQHFQQNFFITDSEFLERLEHDSTSFYSCDFPGAGDGDEKAFTNADQVLQMRSSFMTRPSNGLLRATWSMESCSLATLTTDHPGTSLELLPSSSPVDCL